MKTSSLNPIFNASETNISTQQLMGLCSGQFQTQQSQSQVQFYFFFYSKCSKNNIFLHVFRKSMKMWMMILILTCKMKNKN